jgi:putative Holliday junction resolvase
MRILALDIGEKRVGISISDELGLYAHPLETISWNGITDLIDSLKNLIETKKITELVVGIPYTLKGTISKKTEEVLKIKKSISENVNIPIHEEDERYTTKLAEQALTNVGKKPSKNRDIVDQIAATYILQSFLDRMHKINNK